jgi:hypothetical protein
MYVYDFCNIYVCMCVCMLDLEVYVYMYVCMYVCEVCMNESKSSCKCM